MRHCQAIAVIPTPSAELDALSDRIAELSAHIEAATYQLLCLIREFDERQGWVAAGARSCAHWLSWRIGIGLNAARERVRVTRSLVDLPLISRSLEHGEISFSMARALTRVATPDNEAVLLSYAHHGTASQVEHIVRRYRGVVLAREVETERARQQGRALHIWTDENGMLVIEGRLPPEMAATVLKALELAESLLPRQPLDQEGRLDTKNVTAEISEPTSPAQRRADALELLAQSALAHQLAQGCAADRTQVVLHMDAEALADPEAPGECRFEGDGPVSTRAARRLSCDASVVTMVHDPDRGVLDVSRKTRTVPPALRRALHARDETCCFPGCDHRRYLHAHHLIHWAAGGATSLSNTCLLCSFHHQLVHEGGFGVTRSARGELHFLRPDGRRLPPVPDPTLPVEQAVETLAAHNHQRGLCLTEKTRRIWEGDQLDDGWALEDLWACGSPPGVDTEKRGHKDVLLEERGR